MDLTEPSPPQHVEETPPASTVIQERVSRRDAFIKTKVELPADRTGEEKPAVPRSQGQHQQPPGVSIYIGNMPLNFEREDAVKLLEPYHCVDLKFYAREMKRFAFAVFTAMADAQKAVADLSGKYIDERRLFVNLVRDKSRVRIVEGSYANSGGARGRGRGILGHRGRGGWQGPRGRGIHSMARGPPGNLGNVPMSQLQGATDLVYRVDALLEEVLDQCYFCGRIKMLVKELQHVMNEIQDKAYDQQQYNPQQQQQYNPQQQQQYNPQRQQQQQHNPQQQQQHNPQQQQQYNPQQQQQQHNPQQQQQHNPQQQQHYSQQQQHYNQQLQQQQYHSQQRQHPQRGGFSSNRGRGRGYNPIRRSASAGRMGYNQE